MLDKKSDVGLKCTRWLFSSDNTPPKCFIYYLVIIRIWIPGVRSKGYFHGNCFFPLSLTSDTPSSVTLFCILLLHSSLIDSSPVMRAGDHVSHVRWHSGSEKVKKHAPQFRSRSDRNIKSGIYSSGLSGEENEKQRGILLIQEVQRLEAGQGGFRRNSENAAHMQCRDLDLRLAKRKALAWMKEFEASYAGEGV